MHATKKGGVGGGRGAGLINYKIDFPHGGDYDYDHLLRMMIVIYDDDDYGDGMGLSQGNVLPSFVHIAIRGDG